MFEAIERRDPEAAGQAMRAHLENARRKFNSGSGRLDRQTRQRSGAKQKARRSKPAGSLQSYSAIRSPITRTTEFRPSAAGCAQGAGFDGFEATSDPSLPALARLGLS
ncbi:MULTISPECIES: hypothetical protein [unclassified Mesorhizobium]|uniref:hypothetical protein n=1 Tax=unclassified Mesorhizobium TaxID=325217 RepID=UPI000424E16B|nr:hypothetical protein [Mesorhizobium sp. L2C067A000]